MVEEEDVRNVKKTRSHKIRLYPNNIQQTYLIRACGIKRFVYNWGLAKRTELYGQGEKKSGYDMKKLFNTLKRSEYPFVTEVSKCVADNALIDLDRAYNNFFRELKKGNKNTFPTFKKKGVRDSFRLDNDKVRTEGTKIRVPRLGFVKMAEEVRFAGKILSVTISRAADRWFASISVEFESCVETQGTASCGIDLGVKYLAVTSDGVFYPNPNNWKKDLGRLVRLSRSLSRKQKKSSNRKKAHLKLAKFYMKLTDRRNDCVHKMTTEIARTYSTVCMEDLAVGNMLKNRKLARRIANSLLGETQRQLSYKTNVVVIDRFYPSTKLCPGCRKLNKLKLSQRIYECECGYGPVDRDLHAARNILRAGCPDVKPVETVEDLACGVTVCEAGNVLKNYDRLGGSLRNFL